MSDSTAPDLSPRRIVPPGTSPPDFVAASPHQVARLQYLGVATQEPLSTYEANRIIDQINNDPAFEERIQTWESEKQALHPDLFRTPPRFAGLSVPAVPTAPPADAPNPGNPSSPYAPISGPASAGFVPAGSPPVRPPAAAAASKFFALAAVVAVLAVLGTAGWFARKSPWLLQVLHQPSSIVSLLPGSHSAASANPAVAARPLVQGKPAASALPPEEFARRVAESQRLAVARYPTLGTTTSEINMRFVHRYKLMVDEHNARLQDPNWPLLLADDCAAVSGIKAAGSTGNTPADSNRPRGKSTQTTPVSGGTAHPGSSQSGS